jgi:glutathione S-transferase
MSVIAPTRLYGPALRCNKLCVAYATPWEDLMKLYGGLLSPFVRKVALAATEKGVDFELVLMSPGSADPEFSACSPFGKIPAIRDGDFRLADSTAIFTYLEAKQPEPALLPADPQSRGKAMWYEEFADTILAGAALKILFNRLVGPKILKVGGDETLALQGEAEVKPRLDWLETVAPEQGWLVGDHFTIGDIAVASVLRSLAYVHPGLCPEQHPLASAWYARVAARPAWQAVAEREARR